MVLVGNESEATGQEYVIPIGLLKPRDREGEMRNDYNQGESGKGKTRQDQMEDNRPTVAVRDCY